MNKNDYWILAKRASDEIGWFPTVIFAQWILETGNFQSSNFKQNNNIAGQTWTPQYPKSMLGTPRPTSEGGYYVKYPDPVDGYVDFIRRNPRYSGVVKQTTEEGQIDAIASAGWAEDTRYAENLIRILNQNRDEGYNLELIPQDDAKQIIAILSGYWHEMNGNEEIQTYTHHLANLVRKAAGIATED